MTEQVDSYIPVELARHFRTLAIRVWFVAVAIVLFWVSVITVAPLLQGAGWEGAPRIYSFFSYICHQISERSLHLDGHPMAVCSRCFGVYAGLLAGFLGYPVFRRIEDTDPLPRRWLFLSLVPIGIDWSLNVFGIWENTHFTRLVTGAILGFACAVYIVPAIVEIRQNLAMHRTRG